jgi:hypothetical protein
MLGWNTSLHRMRQMEMDQTQEVLHRKAAAGRHCAAEGLCDDLMPPTGLGALTPLPRCAQCGAKCAPDAKRCRRCGAPFGEFGTPL